MVEVARRQQVTRHIEDRRRAASQAYTTGYTKTELVAALPESEAIVLKKYSFTHHLNEKSLIDFGYLPEQCQGMSRNEFESRTQTLQSRVQTVETDAELIKVIEAMDELVKEYESV